MSIKLTMLIIACVLLLIPAVWFVKFKTRLRYSRRPHDGFDRVFSNPDLRPHVAIQTLKVAHFFGLSKQHIAANGLDAELIAEHCNTCRYADRCFKTRHGKLSNRSPIIVKRCPNYPRFLQIAEAFNHRTPQHHGLGKSKAAPNRQKAV